MLAGEALILTSPLVELSLRLEMILMSGNWVVDELLKPRIILRPNLLVVSFT